MAEVSGKRPFPVHDPEPSRRLTWRRARWPAVACVVAGAVAAALLTWPSSSSPSRAVQAPFADRDGLVVFEQQPSGLLGTAAPDGSHRVMLTRVGALQGNDIPVPSGDGRYLVNLEGQLVTMGPAGPTSVSDVPDSQSGSAALSDGPGWGTASFADGTKYVVVTMCEDTTPGSQLWVADLIPTAGGKDRMLGPVTNAAGDPESPAGIVSASAAASQNLCEGPRQAPDKAIVLRGQGQAASTSTIITAAELTGALGWSPGTPVLLSADPDRGGSRLAVNVAVDNFQQVSSGHARQAVVVITRTGTIVAHLPLPADAGVMQWSPDGQRLAVCQAQKNAPSSVAVWAVGQAVRTIVLPGHHDLACNQLLWSPDGSQLIDAAWVKEGGLTQADDLQRGWTVIDLRSGRVHDVTAPGQPAAWLPPSAGEAR